MRIKKLNLNNIFNTVIATMSFGFRMILSCNSPWTLSTRHWSCLAAHLLLLLPSQLNSLFCLLRPKKLHYTFSTSLLGQIKPLFRGILVYLSKHGVKRTKSRLGFPQFFIFFYMGVILYFCVNSNMKLFIRSFRLN